MVLRRQPVDNYSYYRIEKNSTNDLLLLLNLRPSQLLFSLDVAVAIAFEAKLLTVISISMAGGNYAEEGPWGGSGGEEWTDGTYSDISRIVLRVGNIVDAIQVQYRLLGGSTTEKSRHGGGGGNEITINLGPEEYVTKIKGEEGDYYGHRIVKSLTIITNVKTYGPFGKGGGKAFESRDGRTVVGFHGRSGIYLDRIGVYSQALGNQADEGPWGGAGGEEWTDGKYSDISRIVLRVGNIIDAIQVQYRLPGGSTTEKPRHGGGGGNEITINLDPEEYVTKIKGEEGGYYGHSIVKSLTIITNVKTYGPFGKGGGKAFESPDGRKVIGFNGRSGLHLDRIGVYSQAEEGPWGGSGGEEWKDEPYYDISRIVLRVGDIIEAIQVQYRIRDGGRVFPTKKPRHGGRWRKGITGRWCKGITGRWGKGITINLGSQEYVTKIKGEEGDYNGHSIVKSLTIITNVKAYGPYGIGGGKTFESTDGRKVVGFFGRSGGYLDQIGVYTLISS